MVVGDKVRVDFSKLTELDISTEIRYKCKDVNGKLRDLYLPCEMLQYDNKEYTISAITHENWIRLKDVESWEWSPDWLVKLTNNVKELSW